MRSAFSKPLMGVAGVVLAMAACRAPARGAGGAGSAAQLPAPQTGAPAARPIGGFPHTAADIRFMTGMIPHHAQAVLIAGWAPSHGASDALRRLCERIVVAQQDEIALMQNWLRDRNETVPASDSHHGHDGMLMPGMLTAGQLAQLDAARGVEFDRLFLTFMIQHHEGAVTMVDALFASEGSGQDETVFRLASDIYADQTTEIERMQKMLAALPNGQR